MSQPIAQYVVSFLVNDQLTKTVEHMTSAITGLRGDGVSAMDALTGGMREIAAAAKETEQAVNKVGKAASMTGEAAQSVQEPTRSRSRADRKWDYDPTHLVRVNDQIKKALDKKYSKLVESLPADKRSSAMAALEKARQQNWEHLGTTGDIQTAYGRGRKRGPDEPQGPSSPQELWKNYFNSQLQAAKQIIDELKGVRKAASEKPEQRQKDVEVQSQREENTAKAEKASKRDEERNDTYELKKGDQYVDGSGLHRRFKGYGIVADMLGRAEPKKEPGKKPGRDSGDVARPTLPITTTRHLDPVSGGGMLPGYLQTNIGGLRTMHGLVAGLANDSDRWYWALARVSGALTTIVGSAWFQAKFEEQQARIKNVIASFGYGVSDFDEHFTRLSRRLQDEVGTTFDESNRIAGRALQLSNNNQALADRMANNAAGVARMVGKPIEEVFSAMEAMQHGDVNIFEGILSGAPALQAQFRALRGDTERIGMVAEVAAQGWVILGKEANHLSRGMNTVISAIQKARTALGQIFAPALLSAIRGVGNAFDFVSNALGRMTEHGKNNIAAFARFAAMYKSGFIGNFMVGMNAAAFATDMFSRSQRRAEMSTGEFYTGLAATSFMLAKIPAIGPALAAVVGVAGTLWERLTPGKSIEDKWQNFSGWIAQATAGFRRFVVSSADMTATGFSRVWVQIQRLGEPLGRFWNQVSEIGSRISSALAPVGNFFARIGRWIAESPIGRFFSWLGGKFSDLLSFLGDWDKQFVIADTAMTMMFTHLADSIDFTTIMLRNLGNNWDIMWNNLKNFGEWIRDALPKYFELAFTWIGGQMSKLGEDLKALMEGLNNPAQFVRNAQISSQLRGFVGGMLRATEVQVQSGTITREQGIDRLQRLRQGGDPAYRDLTEANIDEFRQGRFSQVVRRENAEEIAQRERDRRQQAIRDTTPRLQWQPLQGFRDTMTPQEQGQFAQRQRERDNAPAAAAIALQELQNRRFERQTLEWMQPMIEPIANSIFRFLGAGRTPPGGFGAGRNMQEAQWSDPASQWMELQRKAFGPTREQTMEELQRRQLQEQEQINGRSATTNATLDRILQRMGNAFTLPGG